MLKCTQNLYLVFECMSCQVPFPLYVVFLFNFLHLYCCTYLFLIYYVLYPFRPVGLANKDTIQYNWSKIDAYWWKIDADRWWYIFYTIGYWLKIDADRWWFLLFTIGYRWKIDADGRGFLLFTIRYWWKINADRWWLSPQMMEYWRWIFSNSARPTTTNYCIESDCNKRDSFSRGNHCYACLIK